MNNKNSSNNNGSNDYDNRRKTTKGRQKIAIKKLEDKNSLQVTFSKRRSGLFSKAMELCVLCGAEVGIIVFSPNGKIFHVGHPDFDTILSRYLDESAPSSKEVAPIPCVKHHNKEYEAAMMKLEKEKKRAKMIEEEKNKNKNNGSFWWEEPIDDMGIEELEEYVKAMKKLRGKVEMRANEMMMMMNDYLVPKNNINMVNDDHHQDGFVNIGNSANGDISICGGGDFDFNW